MNYQTYQPHPDLSSTVKCYWELEVPASTEPQKQRIVPDGCLELIFILGDNIKRYISEHEFIVQPRAIIVGQITEPFVIQPTGYVHCFAARFYPFGFANITDSPIRDLSNKETALVDIFGNDAGQELEQQVISAVDAEERIAAIENFLLKKFNTQPVIDTIVKTTVDMLLATKGNMQIDGALNQNISRKTLERKFAQQIGLSPKQLAKVIRLQSALGLLLIKKPENLTRVAYESEYYDQSHFNRDFKAFTGINPKDFNGDESMWLSATFYKNE